MTRRWTIAIDTDYLPPVLGFFSFGWLNDKGYL